MSNNAEKIVIVGGGAGGLILATKLGQRLGKKGHAKVTLVDPQMAHFWKPLLHEVAAGTLDSYVDELSYAAHGRNHGYNFCLGAMKGLDREHKQIKIAEVLDREGEQIIPERTLQYDTLVIAVGSATNDFGIPGIREHCLFLDNLPEAVRFQRVFLQRWMAANSHNELQSRKLNVAIVGAGATGVELTAELHTAIREMRYYNLIDLPVEEAVQFSLIDASERILPALKEKVATQTEQILKKLGVAIYTGEIIAQATSEGFHTKSGRLIPADIRVWAAGIKAPDWLANLDGLESNRLNQLVVKPTLQTTNDDNIFAIGDCASCQLEGMDRPVPPRAQSANQQALLLAQSIQARLKKRDLLPYRYVDRGSLVNMSFYSTVGSLMGNLFGKSTGAFVIEGWFARLAYLSLYKMHQSTLLGWGWVVLNTVSNWITRRSKPRLKLH